MAMDFESDEEKAAHNLSKHGVDFELAVRMLLDPNRPEEDDSEPTEHRQRAIGVVDGRVLLVVFTMHEDVCRIISARAAERRERRRYHEG